MDKFRTKLLQNLQSYSLKYPQEKNTTRPFIHFVSQYPNCFSKELVIGHLTASAWLIHEKKDAVLLLFHKKLGKWLQVGGHLEEKDSLKAAFREVLEETGLQAVSLLGEEIFDLDIHTIPAFLSQPCHLHYDIRYLFQAKNSDNLKKNSESLDICWVKFSKIKDYTKENSILRMQEKMLMELGLGMQK